MTWSPKTQPDGAAGLGKSVGSAQEAAETQLSTSAKIAEKGASLPQ